jgi:exosortase
MPWEAIGWFFVLIVVCYFQVIHGLVRQWNYDEDMGHGFFVPLVAGYVAWQRRDELFALTPKANYWGLALLIMSALQYYVAALGAEVFFQRLALVETIFGAVLFAGGTKAFKILFFPLCLLFFMIPLPSIVYTHLTFRLQIFASRVAETLLGSINIPVLREGNVLELASQKLSVVEACSGIRSLLSLGFLSLIYAYFFDQRTWMRLALLIATIPIAIIANAARVTTTGILSEFNPELARGFFHSAEGWVVFMVALVILVMAHQAIGRTADRLGFKPPAQGAV